MVINNGCAGQVQKVDINGSVVSASYSNNTWLSTPAALPPGYPAVQPWFSVAKVTQLAQYNGQALKITVTLRPGRCGTVQSFLPKGLLWYAYFNGVTNNCCGTSSGQY